MHRTRTEWGCALELRSKCLPSLARCWFNSSLARRRQALLSLVPSSAPALSTCARWECRFIRKSISVLHNIVRVEASLLADRDVEQIDDVMRVAVRLLAVLRPPALPLQFLGTDELELGQIARSPTRPILASLGILSVAWPPLRPRHACAALGRPRGGIGKLRSANAAFQGSQLAIRSSRSPEPLGDVVQSKWPSVGSVRCTSDEAALTSNTHLKMLIVVHTALQLSAGSV